MPDGYMEAMKNSGFAYETTASVRKFKCPACGFQFSMVYARTIACKGCPDAIKGCPKMRCAKCDYEFWIQDTPWVNNKLQERYMADHMNNVVTAFRNDYGYKRKA
ncbi:MAG: hypothetical protein II855_06695 [Candidatus Methanomethylophilaceae archaeon]|jgi:hypothetical protein|nr:hypothetical protein [Candidatus Methanomethylophilaceae archaeon]